MCNTVRPRHRRTTGMINPWRAVTTGLHLRRRVMHFGSVCTNAHPVRARSHPFLAPLTEVCTHNKRGETNNNQLGFIHTHALGGMGTGNVRV